jgi:protein-S-isoprenylcysteine O-methyltransferase Ste14
LSGFTDPRARNPRRAALIAPAIVKGLRSTLIAVVPLAALLLVTAGLSPGGTWVWPQGLWFLGAYGGTALVGATLLALYRPANFRVRQQSIIAAKDRRQPWIDAVGSTMLIAYLFAWLAFIPADVFYLRIGPRPDMAVSVAGGALVLLGLALNQLAIWQNPFATPNVQDQVEDGQRVIDTGIYGLIRHPIYAGNLSLFGGAALWLGSYAAFAGVGVMLAATIGRIVIEEAHLRANLAGYAEYESRVRGRLIPYVL